MERELRASATVPLGLDPVAAHLTTKSVSRLVQPTRPTLREGRGSLFQHPESSRPASSAATPPDSEGVRNNLMSRCR